ncbi:MAG: alpha/beta fold hydrolase [Ferruginibacter sp.]
MSKSKTFVLVHGAWQAPYVWDNVKKQIEKNGNKVIVVDLPGHGDDQTPPVKASIDAYRDKVIEAMNGSNEKVILVGHSMGGMVISAVAEKIPGQISKLVYVGAYVPTNGQSLLDLANMDKQSLLGPSLIPSKDQLTLDVKKENLISIFCQDGSEDVKKLLLSKYKAEPAIPFANKVILSAANFGSVDKYYIHTAQDHAVGIDLQNQMVSNAHITKVFSVESGHSPFLSKPNDLSSLLLSFAK